MNPREAHHAPWPPLTPDRLYTSLAYFFFTSFPPYSPLYLLAFSSSYLFPPYLSSLLPSLSCLLPLSSIILSSFTSCLSSFSSFLPTYFLFFFRFIPFTSCLLNLVLFTSLLFLLLTFFLLTFPLYLPDSPPFYLFPLYICPFYLPTLTYYSLPWLSYPWSFLFLPFLHLSFLLFTCHYLPAYLYFLYTLPPCPNTYLTLLCSCSSLPSFISTSPSSLLTCSSYSFQPSYLPYPDTFLTFPNLYLFSHYIYLSFPFLILPLLTLPLLTFLFLHFRTLPSPIHSLTFHTYPLSNLHSATTLITTPSYLTPFPLATRLP